MVAELPFGQAHVWIVPAPDDPLVDQLRTVLSVEENARSDRFAMAHSRREYITAHALCRIMLSNFSETSPPDWRFETGPHGRPEIAGSGGDGLRFNISHTRGLVCVAVARGRDIGVDVEWTGRDNQLDKIARAKFAKPETALLDKMPESGKRRGFFSLWTLKEAYIKAIGKGLAEPLEGFAFSLEPLAIDFLNGQDDPKNWRFDLFGPAPDYLCAVALRHGGENHPDIVRRVIGATELVRLA